MYYKYTGKNCGVINTSYKVSESDWSVDKCKEKFVGLSRGSHLRQHRTKLVRRLRRQVFRQIVQARRRRADARQGELVQYDGKYANKMCAKREARALCGVALRGYVYGNDGVTEIPHSIIILSTDLKGINYY